jgi:plastocyanin
MPVRLAAFAALLLVAGVAAGIIRSQQVHADDQTVSVGNLYFCGPAFEGQVCDTTVTVGDTVTWAHVEGFHTVTECGANFSPCPKAGGFDSGTLSGGSFQQTFNQAGEYWYECVFHPDQMQGRVVVAELQATPTQEPLADATASPVPTATGRSAQTPAGVPRGGGPPANHTGGWPWIAGAGIVLMAVGIGVSVGRRA